MKHTSENKGHNTSKLKRETKTVTIIHRFHPLYGQIAKVISIRRGTYAWLTIELADGTKATVEADHTDFVEVPSQGAAATSTPLLDIDGLLNIAKLIKQVDSEG